MPVTRYGALLALLSLGALACELPKPPSTTSGGPDAATEAPKEGGEQAKGRDEEPARPERRRALEALVPSTAQAMIRLDQGALSWRTLAQLSQATASKEAEGLWVASGGFAGLSAEALRSMGLDSDAPAAIVRHQGAVLLLMAPSGDLAATAEALSGWLKESQGVTVSVGEEPATEDEDDDAETLTVLKAGDAEQGRVAAVLLEWRGAVALWWGDAVAPGSLDPVQAARAWVAAAATPRLLTHPPYAITRLKARLNAPVLGYVALHPTGRREAQGLDAVEESVSAVLWGADVTEEGALSLTAVALQTSAGRAATRTLLAPRPPQDEVTMTRLQSLSPMGALVWLAAEPAALAGWVPDLQRALAPEPEPLPDVVRERLAELDPSDPDDAERLEALERVASRGQPLKLDPKELTGRLVLGLVSDHQPEQATQREAQRGEIPVYDGVVAVEMTSPKRPAALLAERAEEPRAALELIEGNIYAIQPRREPLAYACAVGAWLVLTHPDRQGRCRQLTAPPPPTAADGEGDPAEPSTAHLRSGARVAKGQGIVAALAWGRLGAAGALLQRLGPAEEITWTARPHPLGLMVEAEVPARDLQGQPGAGD